ncbi:MAG: DUF4926 domain-containing protein [Anaerolineae bacterium]|nr:DUF4926 domain-containing protein [Anaerolineae bacterium]
MTIKLFDEVALAIDIPEQGLKRGDVATVVEHHARTDVEDGYTLEVFNAMGDTITVLTIPASAIIPLTAREIFTVRSLVA